MHLSLSHFEAALLFALFTSIVMGVVGRNSDPQRLHYGLPRPRLISPQVALPQPTLPHPSSRRPAQGRRNLCPARVGKLIKAVLVLVGIYVVSSRTRPSGSWIRF